MSAENQPKPPGVIARVFHFTTGALKLILPIAVLVGAGVGVKIMMDTAPHASRATPQRIARLVETREVWRTQGRAEIHVRGEVMPALEVTITPQVSGKVIEISDQLVPGGYFSAGDTMLVIDDRDYAYTLEQRRTELARAQANLVLEKGSQDVAAREYEVLGQDLSESDRALVFREPQLEIAEAAVNSAQAMLDDAKLDLERTQVNAPFDSLVVNENVDLGANLNAQAMIARVVGTDRYWVEIAVPQSELRWIDLPNGDTPGSEVIFTHTRVWGPDKSRTGHVIRLLPELTETGKMSRLLVEVDDPMSLKPENAEQPRLLVGQSLEAQVLGRNVDNVFSIDREHIHDENNVWVVTKENTLSVRQITVAFQGRDVALVESGLENGERIITSNVSVVSDGMPVRDAGANASEETDDADRGQS